MATSRLQSSVIRLVLWLLVINLGIAFGAGLYESRIELPQWISDSSGQIEWKPEEARQADTGVRFWAYVTTGPLTLLMIAGFILVFKSKPAVRKWFLPALVVLLAERLFTFSFFIPTMIGLMDATSGTDPAVIATAVRWERLNYVRHLLSLCAWLLTLKAFVTEYATGKETIRS